MITERYQMSIRKVSDDGIQTPTHCIGTEGEIQDRLLILKSK